MIATSLGLLLHLALGTAAEAQPVHPLEPVPIASDHYSETYTAIADLDDGTYVQLQLGLSNFGPGDERGYCRALIARSGAAPWTANRRGESRSWRYAASPSPTFSVDGCSLAATKTGVTVEATLEGRKLTLQLDASLTPVRPPDGHHDIAGDHGGVYESTILVPFAPARFTVQRGEAAPKVQHGAGYLDHSRSSALPDALARGWLRFRALAGPCARLLLVRLPPTSGAAVGWTWRRGEAAPTPLEPVEVELPERGQDASGDAIRLRAGEESFVITPRFMFYRHAPVEEIGWLGRLLKAWFGNPVTRTYRAAWHGDSATCGDVAGILEITHVTE